MQLAWWASPYSCSLHCIVEIRSALERLTHDYSLLTVGISDAYYCAECTRLEKDRDGCPKIVNLGASRTDLFYERRRLGGWSRLLRLFPFGLTCHIPAGFKKG